MTRLGCNFGKCSARLGQVGGAFGQIWDRIDQSSSCPKVCPTLPDLLSVRPPVARSWPTLGLHLSNLRPIAAAPRAQWVGNAHSTLDITAIGRPATEETLTIALLEAPRTAPPIAEGSRRALLENLVSGCMARERRRCRRSLLLAPAGAHQQRSLDQSFGEARTAGARCGAERRP